MRTLTLHIEFFVHQRLLFSLRLLHRTAQYAQRIVPILNLICANIFMCKVLRKNNFSSNHNASKNFTTKIQQLFQNASEKGGRLHPIHAKAMNGFYAPIYKMNYKIVTVSNRFPTEWYYLTKQFFESVKGYNGLLVDYSAFEGWKGLATKPKWLYRAIKEGNISEKFIIFSDAWDLVFCNTPEKILEQYKSFGVDVVISSEKNCFPADLKEHFDSLNPPTPYKYLNSGFIVGKTEAILACLEAMDLPNVKDDYHCEERGCAIHSNDQHLWQIIFEKQPVKIALDYYQSLCQTLHDVSIDELDLSGERIRNKITNSTPCSFHANGNAKTGEAIRHILKHLKLE